MFINKLDKFIKITQAFNIYLFAIDYEFSFKYNFDLLFKGLKMAVECRNWLIQYFGLRMLFPKLYMYYLITCVDENSGNSHVQFPTLNGHLEHF